MPAISPRAFASSKRYFSDELIQRQQEEYDAKDAAEQARRLALVAAAPAKLREALQQQVAERLAAREKERQEE